MNVVAVVSIVSWFAFFAGVAVAPDHKFSGCGATLVFLAMFASSLMLAFHSL